MTSDDHSPGQIGSKYFCLISTTNSYEHNFEWFIHITFYLYEEFSRKLLRDQRLKKNLIFMKLLKTNQIKGKETEKYSHTSWSTHIIKENIRIWVILRSLLSIVKFEQNIYKA